MLPSKILRNSGALVSRNVLQVRKSGELLRKFHVAAVPPRVKISFTEKLGLCVVFGISMWFVPLWVVYHVPDYQKENRNEYTGK